MISNVRQIIFTTVLIIFLGACAGPVKYSIENSSGENLIYSSNSERWHSGEKNRKIPTGKITEVLFAPEFLIETESGEKLEYQIPYSEELAKSFKSKWDASDVLYVVVNRDYEIQLKKRKNIPAATNQPKQLGFPAKPL